MAFIRTKLEEAVVISFEGFKLCSGQVHPKGDFQVGPVNGIRSAGNVDWRLSTTFSGMGCFESAALSETYLQNLKEIKAESVSGD